MSTIGWIILVAAIVVAVVVVMLVVARASSARRREHLQDRFGPEYDRTVDESASRRDAEKEVAEREPRPGELDIRRVSCAARSRFSDEWNGVQQRFLDDPEGATSQAERLVRRALDQRRSPAAANT